MNDARGGINQVDPPNSIAERQLVDSRNLEHYAGGIGRKRQGCAEPAGLTYDTTAGAILTLARYVGTAGETATELWAVNDQASFSRMAAAALTFSPVTPSPDPTFESSKAHLVNMASLNGKLFIAADSGEDRLHVWDGTNLRRVGIAASAAPSVGTDTGAVTDTRKYKVSWIKKSGSTIEVRSELSAATSPQALSSQKAVVTKPTAPGESETHWELWAASDDDNYATYWYVGEAAKATSTIDDNNATLEGEVAYDVGTFTVPGSVKYLLSDDNRLVLAGSWEDSSLGSRVFFTPALGDADIGDDERIVLTTTQKNYHDCNPGEGGPITALGGPMMDAVYVFKTSQTYKLVKTGLVTNPYRLVNVHRQVGAISQKSVVLAEDEGGAQSLYFLSRRGPYRIGPTGMEYIGLDIEPLWETINLDAQDTVAHGVYHSRKHQIWWWVATGSSDTPNLLLVYDTRWGQSSELGVRGGWSVYTGDMAEAACSVMYAEDLGNATLTYELKPYIAPVGVDDMIYLCDKAGTYTDAGTGYQTYLKTKVFAPTDYDQYIRVEGVQGLFKPNADSSPCLWVRVRREYGAEFAEYHLNVPPNTVADRVLVDAPEPTSLSAGPKQAQTAQLYVYDSADQQVGWQLEALQVQYTTEEQR